MWKDFKWNVDVTNMKILFEALNAEAGHRENTERRYENLEELLQRTSNSENEGKWAKYNRKALTESWKPENESLKRGRMLLAWKEATHQADFALKNPLVTLFGEKIVCVEENKNLFIHHAKISKERSKISYRSGTFMFERYKKEMGKVSGIIHEVKWFYLFFWTKLSILESAWKFLSMNFILPVHSLLHYFSITLERTKFSKTAKSPSEHSSSSIARQHRRLTETTILKRL